MQRIAIVVAALGALVGCKSDAPPAGAPATVSVSVATSAAASASAPASAAASASATTSAPAGAPVAYGLRLTLDAVPETAPAASALRLDFALENVSAAPIKLAYYAPLGFGLELTDPTSGKRVPLTIPAIDTPVQRIEITLAPGQVKKLPSGVRLVFDPTGKAKGSMFEWIVVAKRGPLALDATFSVELGDAGSVTLRASARSS